jgi:hypothetical protein
MTSKETRGTGVTLPTVKRVLLFLLSSIFVAGAAIALEPCRIVVREKGSGWPVPLVELRTVHEVRFVTDNAGVIAFDLPEAMGRETWLKVIGHGYQAPKDGFGFRGFRVTPAPGQRLEVEVERVNIARRLGRITGAGIFAESQKVGEEPGWQDSGVFGCDSVQNAVHRGRLFWAWGDTLLSNYPLGIYDMTSAVTTAQPLASFEPPVHLPLDLFRDATGKPRGVAKMPGAGPTWVTGYASLRDNAGAARLVGTYRKIRHHLEVYESGLCVWNDAKAEFEQLRVLWTKSAQTPTEPLAPDGHPSFWKDEQGKEWVLFGNPLPQLRCPANFAAWQDSSTWEKLAPPKSFVSASDGTAIAPHSGSIAWNPFRKRWVTVFLERFGKPSAFGEIWYAEADTPLGPWGKAVKILTHENYTFYNPRLHPEFTPPESAILIFEGTFTAEFADRPEPTPRYNYNQILYRLDLDDPKLAPAREEVSRKQ